MLSPDRRQQLDGIVQQMASQNAPQQDVQAVVSDFVGKYGNESPDANTGANSTPPQEPYNPLKEAAQPFIGAAKGVASTLFTVPQSIARVTDAVTRALEGGHLDESMANLAKVTTALIHKANSLPDTDPNKKHLMDLAEQNVKQLDMLRGDQNTRDQKSSSLNEKPQVLQPTTTGQKIGYGAEKIGEFLTPGGAITKGEKAIQASTELATKAGRITPLVQKTLNVVGGAGLEGLGAATVNEAQTGNTSLGLRRGSQEE